MMLLALGTTLSLMASSGCSGRDDKKPLVDEAEPAGATETAGVTGERRGIAAIAGMAERKVQRARERSRQRLQKIEAIVGMGDANEERAGEDAGDGDQEQDEEARQEEAARKRAEAMRIAAQRAQLAREARQVHAESGDASDAGCGEGSGDCGS